MKGGFFDSGDRPRSRGSSPWSQWRKDERKLDGNSNHRNARVLLSRLRRASETPQAAGSRLVGKVHESAEITGNLFSPHAPEVKFPVMSERTYRLEIAGPGRTLVAPPQLLGRVVR